jgi:hypothetical protein
MLPINKKLKRSQKRLIRMPPYAKYMKDIFTNKRKIPNEEISTLLANYSFDGKVPEKLGDPGIPTIPLLH